MDKYIFCIIYNELSICGRMVGLRTRDPRWGLKLSRFVSSCMVLIRQVDLGSCMMRARRRPNESRFKGHGTHNALFFLG